MKKTCSGSWRCGDVQSRVDLDLAAGTTRCNCSFGTKSRFWLALVKADAREHPGSLRR